FGVVHPGSRNMGFEGGPRAKCASSLANAETISLAVAAASAGHKKGVKGTKAHRQCKRHHQTVGLTRRIVNAAERQNLRHFAVQRNADAHTRGRRSCFLNLARSLRQGRRIDGMRTGPATSAGDPARAAQRRRFLLRCAPLTHCTTCYTSSVILGLGVSPMRRREFIALLGGGVAGWPLAARAQQPAMPVIGFINGGSADALARFADAFRNGLGETGYVSGQNVTVEYHWLEGQYHRVPALVADLVRRRVAVIAAPAAPAAIAAKAATATIPIVFALGDDPVKLGLVASLARPGGNATGINFFNQEVAGKRLALLHELVTKAVRVTIIVNPTDVANTESTLRDVPEAARTIGLQFHILNATTIEEIDAAFATLAHEGPGALFVSPDGFFTSRRVQFATLTARYAIPAAFSQREFVEVGGLMSYGTNIADMFRQVGVYSGNILKGAKPSDLPVVQASKFEFTINLQTARALGIEVPPGLLTIADEVIE